MAKNMKSTSSVDFDVKGAIILVSVLTFVVILIYGLTIGAQRLGWFNEGYNKPEISNAVISYENILAGTIFNRHSGEYYVAIADFDSDDNIYLNSVISSYKNKDSKLNLYGVNLSNEMNKSIIKDSSNPSAQSVDTLAINTPTLILIRDGRNVRYVEGVDNIKLELGV